jgi:hypothetical protein
LPISDAAPAKPVTKLFNRLLKLREVVYPPHAAQKLRAYHKYKHIGGDFLLVREKVTDETQYSTLYPFLAWWAYFDKILRGEAMNAYKLSEDWLVSELADELNGHTLQFYFRGEPTFQVGYWLYPRDDCHVLTCSHDLSPVIMDLFCYIKVALDELLAKRGACLPNGQEAYKIYREFYLMT